MPLTSTLHEGFLGKLAKVLQLYPPFCSLPCNFESERESPVSAAVSVHTRQRNPVDERGGHCRKADTAKLLANSEAGAGSSEMTL